MRLFGWKDKITGTPLTKNYSLKSPIKLDDLFLPILQILSDGIPRHREIIIDILRKDSSLTEVDTQRLNQGSSGDLVGWATWYLKTAGLITRERAVSCITEQGLNILLQNLDSFSLRELKEFPEYKAYIPKKRV